MPEICNGRSGQCPLDIYKKNGNQCEINKGYCFNGVCPTLDSQCRLIWGDGIPLNISNHQKEKEIKILELNLVGCLKQADFRATASVSSSSIRKDQSTAIAVRMPTTITFAAMRSTSCADRCNAKWERATPSSPEWIKCIRGLWSPWPDGNSSASINNTQSHPHLREKDSQFTHLIARPLSVARITSGTVAAADLPDLGIVRDGTPCGNSLVRPIVDIFVFYSWMSHNNYHFFLFH